MSKLYQTLRVLLQNNMKVIKEYHETRKKSAYSPKKKLFIMNSQDWEKSNHIVFLMFVKNFGQMFAEMRVEWAKLEVIRVVCSFSFVKGLR